VLTENTVFAIWVLETRNYCLFRFNICNERIDIVQWAT